MRSATTGEKPGMTHLRPLTSEKPVQPGIYRVYGWTGVLMAIAFLLSGVWTLALAVTQLAPSQVANYVMGTAYLDNGDFWTLQKAHATLANTAATLLGLCSLGYFGLVFTMMRTTGVYKWFLRRRARLREVNPFVEQPRAEQSMGSRNSFRSDKPTYAVSNGVRLWLRNLPKKIVVGVFKSHETPVFALPKLLLQTTLLFKYLREGFPQPTIFFYASLLMLNWMISTYCAMVQLVDPRAPLVRMFYSFDLFFAVFAPLQTIIYAYHQFYFDGTEFAVRMETLDPGGFDVTARLFADPSEVSHVRSAFRSLQLSSVDTLAVKAILNVLAIQKWWQTIQLLGDSTHRSVISPALRLGRFSRFLSVLFFGMGVAGFVYTIVAVVSSQHICARYVQCKAPSYRWNVGTEHCSCSVFVDRATQVTSFAEWENPIDTTANLAALAASGDLKVVQIINRRLPTLPDELRRCKGLEQLILIYTKIITIPTWAKELTNLEHLHVEGDFTPKRLQALPRDLFHNMPKLAFLHLGCLCQIPFVPDLDRVPQLKYLTMAVLHSVTEIPALNNLPKLEWLAIIDATHVATLPSIASLKKLKSLVIAARNPMCCNGFLNAKCDLTEYSCRDRTAQGESPITCTNQHIDSRDEAVLNAVGFPVCPEVLRDIERVAPTHASSDEMCGGVFYKRCELNGVQGMCYPARMSVVTCTPNSEYELMRRKLIERGIGVPCDPVVEAWLGCRPTTSKSQ